MQKPQQRKYHSSCNRSVHRGTAHGKQEVKVCKRKTPHLLVRSFLPPCGDGTSWLNLDKDELLFSPPYGDKLQRLRGKSPREGQAFAPPYGDCTKSHATQEEKQTLSPPYGDGTACFLTLTYDNEFSPPYGDGTVIDASKPFLFEFSPPYGDGTVEWRGFFLRHFVFAPLRGWYEHPR